MVPCTRPWKKTNHAHGEAVPRTRRFAGVLIEKPAIATPALSRMQAGASRPDTRSRCGHIQSFACLSAQSSQSATGGAYQASMPGIAVSTGEALTRACAEAAGGLSGLHGRVPAQNLFPCGHATAFTDLAGTGKTTLLRQMAGSLPDLALVSIGVPNG